MKPAVDISEMQKPLKSAIFIPTNLPDSKDPRDIGKRSLARFRVAIDYTRQLREIHGRSSVLLVVFGGWPLHTGIPLSIQQLYGAIRLHNILEINEVDFVTSYGVNSVTDLHSTLQWMKDNILNISDAYVVTSQGHAARMVAESGMQSLFQHIYHIETHEPRYTKDEDEIWTYRAKTIPSHQYVLASRAQDVERNGSIDSLEWIQTTKQWAESHPKEFKKYADDLWMFVKGLEENNVAVRSLTPGGWHININC